MAWPWRTFAAFILLAGVATDALAGWVERAIDGDDLCLCGDNDPFVSRFAGNSDRCDRACVRVRLCGIDAPELRRPGGREAQLFLDSLTRRKVTTCIAVGEGTPCDGRSAQRNRDRVVAQCFTDGRDLACELVKNGHARDWQKYSGDHYARREQGGQCRDH